MNGKAKLDDPQLITDIERHWYNRVSALNLRKGSARRANEQACFFAGAIAALEAQGYGVPAAWISVVFGRDLIAERTREYKAAKQGGRV